MIRPSKRYHTGNISLIARYYTKGKYMGWIKLSDYAKQSRELKHWIHSGNELRIGNTLINDPEYITSDIFPAN